MKDDIAEFEEYHEMKLPRMKIVCPGCRGNGTHVNRAIDGNGLTHEDFAADPDFFEDYMAGMYDVRCEECNGQNVIDIVDESRCEPDLFEMYMGWVSEAAAYRAEVMMERKYGA